MIITISNNDNSTTTTNNNNSNDSSPPASRRASGAALQLLGPIQPRVPQTSSIEGMGYAKSTY